MKVQAFFAYQDYDAFEKIHDFQLQQNISETESWQILTWWKKSSH